MKKIKKYLLFGVILCSQQILSKDIVHYEFNNSLFVFTLDFNNQTYDLWKSSGFTGGSQIVEGTTFTKGSIKENKSYIFCNEKSKTTFVLKRIDKYRMVIIKSIRYLKSKDTLYATSFNDHIAGLYIACGWKNGKRSGRWMYFLKNNVKFEIYKDNILLKTYFKTYKELRKERLDCEIRL